MTTKAVSTAGARTVSVNRVTLLYRLQVRMLCTLFLFSDSLPFQSSCYFIYIFLALLSSLLFLCRATSSVKRSRLLTQNNNSL